MPWSSSTSIKRTWPFKYVQITLKGEWFTFVRNLYSSCTQIIKKGQASVNDVARGHHGTSGLSASKTPVFISLGRPHRSCLVINLDLGAQQDVDLKACLLDMPFSIGRTHLPVRLSFPPVHYDVIAEDNPVLPAYLPLHQGTWFVQVNGNMDQYTSIRHVDTWIVKVHKLPQQLSYANTA